MNTHDIELLPLPEPDQYTWYSRNLVESIRKRAIEPYAKRIADLESQIEADRQRRGDNNTGRNDATQDALNKVAEVFCMDPDELDDPYTVVSAAKDFFANWELDRKNWDRKCRGEPVAFEIRYKSTAPASVELTPYPARAEEARGLGFEVHELVRRDAAPQPAEPVNEEELLAAREALIDMGYLWDGDQWVEVDPPSKTAEQAPEWPDFACMEASLQRLKERLVFENGRRKDLEQRLREKRNG